jgi:hypothetical protein
MKDGEEKIKKDYDELLEQMTTSFRNLEDWSMHTAVSVKSP